MKYLLITDVPPCQNYTAGLVLERLVRFLDPKQLAICTVVNKALAPDVSSDIAPHILFNIDKPRERAFRFPLGMVGSATSYMYELAQEGTIHILASRIAELAVKEKIDALWVVLQGQTMVRLARLLSAKLRIPLYIQVWDPFGWWLRENNIDKLTSKRLLNTFDDVLRSSSCCATASWAMSTHYEEKYKIRTKPVIAGLPAQLARKPAEEPGSSRGDYVIGMAGQFYAENEWSAFIQALHLNDWKINGRSVRVRVLGAGFKHYTHVPCNFEYFGWRTQEETIDLLSDVDLLYLPYWFSEDFREESSLSFPSKLVTYFAAGRPVFFHGPEYASPAKYLQNHASGVMCHSQDPSVILQKLSSLFEDNNFYADLSQRGHDCFIKDFTLESMRRNFYEFLDLK